MKKRIGMLFLVSMILFTFALPAQAIEQNAETLVLNTDVCLRLSPEQQFVEKTIQIDSGHYLIVRLKEEQSDEVMRSTIRRKLTSEYVVKNVTGRVIGTLTVKGIFDTNGSSSVPYNVYGYGSVVGYDVQNTENSMGNPGSSSWVSSTLVCVPQDYLADFARTCTITCDANGVSHASWN